MTMQTFVDDTLALFDHLEVGAAHVYGQSFGGMVAQELALASPGRVLTVILAATHCGGSHVAPARTKVPKDRPYLSLYSEAFVREHPDHVAEDVLVGSQWPQKPYAARRQREAMQGFDSYDRLPRLQAPTLVLHGTEDRVVAPENARILAERIPNAELHLLDGAGHVYHSEQPDEADAAVLEFIRKHRR
jgi:pimeloyl-ACP methyl ester carboxylesterase